MTSASDWRRSKASRDRASYGGWIASCLLRSASDKGFTENRTSLALKSIYETLNLHQLLSITNQSSIKRRYGFDYWLAGLNLSFMQPSYTVTSMDLPYIRYVHEFDLILRKNLYEEQLAIGKAVPTSRISGKAELGLFSVRENIREGESIFTIWKANLSREDVVERLSEL